MRDKLITQFDEKINIDKAKRILLLSNNQIKEKFWDGKEICKNEDKKYKWKPYIADIKRYLKKIIKSNGIIIQKYKYGGKQIDGRLYVNGWGLQRCQKIFEIFYVMIIIVN